MNLAVAALVEPKALRLAGITLTALVALGASLLIQGHYRDELSKLTALYREEATADSAAVANRVASRLEAVYQGIRTMARLPGVRKIKRHAENFDENSDAHRAMQEIYNNLASTVALSEVYVVPHDLDTSKTDPVTGVAEAPITTFDEFIVQPESGAAKAESPEAKADDLPEEETYEYLEMAKQNAWFSRRYSKESSIAWNGERHTLDYPAIASGLLITCDNDTGGYRASRKDEDRSGIVYSVPFYDEDGAIKGMISAVVLGNVLRNLLSDDAAGKAPGSASATPRVEHVLLNRDYALSLGATGSALVDSRRYIAQGAPDPNLLHSAIQAVQVRDDFSSNWQLWTGLPDDLFWSRDDVKAARVGRAVSWMAVGIVWLLALLGLETVVRRLARRAVADADLEARLGIAERVGDVAEQIGRGAQILAATATQLAATISQIRGNVEDSARQAARASESAQVVGSRMLQARSGTEAMREAALETAERSRHAVDTAHAAAAQATRTGVTVDALRANSDQIQSVVDLIRDVAEQTNLLALNASIEAARAGEAGRGFTVVANEVKTLAAETARATERIDVEVRGMRRAALESVSELEKISTVVSTIEVEQKRFSGNMQARIESTNEVTGSVGEAASLAAEIQNLMGKLADAAAGTRTDVDEIAGTISELSRMAEEMNTSVQDLIQLSTTIRSNA